jgi:hypothetical protein
MTGQIKGKLDLLGPDQRECLSSEARSEGLKLHMGRSEGILACLGPDQREYKLPEARSEGIKFHRRQIRGIMVHRGQIRENIYFLKPDQRV